MEVLNPLAVLDVGLLTRHILNVLRVNQAHFNLALLQNLKKRNPVNASGLHRDRLNLALLKPVSQLFQIGRERVKATNWIRVAFGWNCDENLGCAYVDPSGIGLHYWQTYGLESLLGILSLRSAQCVGPDRAKKVVSQTRSAAILDCGSHHCIEHGVQNHTAGRA